MAVHFISLPLVKLCIAPAKRVMRGVLMNPFCTFIMQVAGKSKSLPDRKFLRPDFHVITALSASIIENTYYIPNIYSFFEKKICLFILMLKKAN